MITRADYCPKYMEISTRKNIFKKYPLAIVNAKKIAGGSSANWNTIWKYAERDKFFLYRQIREILKPNIIVCGGSNDTGISEKFSVLPSIAFFKISKMDSEKSIIGVIIILKKRFC